MKLQNVGSNQTVLTIDGNRVFFSYNTPVAAEIGGVFYRTEKKFSVTTSKHINKWLDGVKAEVKCQDFFENLTGNHSND